MHSEKMLNLTTIQTEIKTRKSVQIKFKSDDIELEICASYLLYPIILKFDKNPHFMLCNKLSTFELSFTAITTRIVT